MRERSGRWSFISIFPSVRKNVITAISSLPRRAKLCGAPTSHTPVQENKEDKESE